MTGIYKIVNNIDNKIYIGQSTDIEHRWCQHRYEINRKIEHPLYCDMRKYGIENFSFEIVEECSLEDLDEKEKYWIKYYNTTEKEKGYNIELGGKNNKTIYDYDLIYEYWEKGYSCQQLQEKFNCGDSVITRMLRKFNISESEAKSRSCYKKQFVALSKDNYPLRIFNGANDISRFFTGFESKANNIEEKIKKHQSLFGYYWDHLTENNYPERNLTDKEFLSYQMPKTKELTREEKEILSKNQRIVNRPSREQLKQLIRTKSFTEIGKMYGVSDNAIRKWCDFENLPRKKGQINSYSDKEWELV